ncbi:tRNA (cytidine(34)-2'-O)-methyltransferase [Caulobacter sp. S45]|jgi:tRNA (cytidine/uridine-2'-O-)-methyltransferase|uniref:tRNA (cytidine(34)-2'-O)-methyltransferase n=1 Tax=Caulobacter sp. S45 TaxID=1641861 RepID=UPI00131B6F47|nr:tRNA (cytidine(34)-2'-O)-methyltransferase [Caulobacter sp. S45]
MRLALFQPDIPQNLGAAIRLTACMAIGLDIIEPCGFPLSDKAVGRAAMDYGESAEVRRHDSWTAFLANRAPGRLLLLTTRASIPYCAYVFRPGDTLLLGRESAGVPDSVHAAADARLLVPMASDARSLNVIVSAAMVLGEALRQTKDFPPLEKI